MSYFSRMFKGWRSNATEQRKGSQDSTPLTTAHDDSPSVGVDSSLQVSTVWACVTLLVENIASLPLMVYQVDSQDQRITAKNQRIYAILHDSPNKRQTSMEFWMFMILNLVLRGNAYARIDRDHAGEVIALWPLASDQMEVIVADDGSLVYVYSYGQDGVVYLESDIMHIRGMGNGVIGMSPLEYMRSSVSVAIEAQNHTKRTFKKDARRPGVLMSDKVLNKEQRQAVRDNFGDIATGSGRELYVLEAQFKFEPLGMSPADIQLLETRRFAVQDLARWFGVPSILINDTSESTSLGSSVQQIVDGFHKLKLRPMLEMIEQVIHQRVLTPKQRSQGIVAEFNLDALLRSSLKDRMEIHAKAVQNGLKTRNECRKNENLPELSGGEMLTAQMNLMPVDKLGEPRTMGGSVPPATVEQ